jgi:hypothetical protein
VTFLGDHLLDLELEDPWDEPKGTRSSRTNRALERWLEQEERDHRAADRHRDSLDCPSQGHYHRHANRQRSPPPQSETKVVRFKERTCKEGDREMEDSRSNCMASQCMKSPRLCCMRGALTDPLTSLKTSPSLSLLGTCPLLLPLPPAPSPSRFQRRHLHLPISLI